MTKFDRIAKVKVRLRKETFDGYIGQLLIENLRIAFQITKSLSYSTNTCSLQIYNMSAEKRARLKDYGDEITISAGYKEETGEQLLFIGDTTRVTHLFEHPEIISTMDCGDGERVLNQKLVDLSFGPNTEVRTVLKTIASNLGIDLQLGDTPNLVYENGFQFSGIAKDSIDKVSNYLGLTWSVQNGILQTIPKNGSTKKPAITISENDGMVSVPQRYTYKRRDLYRAGPKQGWKVKTLLMPNVVPGDKVKLISKKLNLSENLVVDSVKHNGDTWGNPWVSDWELVAL